MEGEGYFLVLLVLYWAVGERYFACLAPKNKTNRPWFLGLLSLMTFQVTPIFASGGVLDYSTERLDCHRLVPWHAAFAISWHGNQVKHWTAGSHLWGLPLLSWLWTYERCLLNNWLFKTEPLMRIPGGGQLKIKGKYNGISQEAGTLLLHNFLTEMNCGSDILCQAVRPAEVMKSKNHRKLKWYPSQES